MSAEQSSTHNCSAPTICGPANFTIDSDPKTFCHTNRLGDEAPWVGLMFSDPVWVKAVEINNHQSWDRVGTIDIRITNSLPTDGWFPYTGEEFLGSIFGQNTSERVLTLNGSPKQGLFLLVQLTSKAYPNSTLIIREIRVFGIPSIISGKYF